MNKKNYILDQERRIWRNAASQSIQYSDGDKAEEYLLSVVKNAKNVSTTSQELLLAIRDWSSEYHLSWVRHNLLRPLQIKKTDSVLEMGSGCGALSRYLGENAAKVVGVEGSRRRAEIAAERCRDLPNVTIYCENIADFEIDDKFDVITFIGVLEYARMFINSDDPIRSCLEQARSFLKKDGILIVAIENQLGLKYFNGCSEDHTGIPYYGLNDRYGQSSPVTFGHREFSNKLAESHFSNVYFYYPFPDYKLPSLILTQDAIGHPSLRLEDLFCEMYSRDYTDNPYRSFHENRVWPLLVRNDMLHNMSNSFLVVASSGNETESRMEKKSWLSIAYTTERLTPYVTETRILEADDGVLEVTKKLVFPETKTAERATLPFSHMPPSRCSYLYGKLLLAELQRILAAEQDTSKVIRLWVEFLWEQSSEYGNPSATIPGNYMDCIPKNLIVDVNGKIHFFDAEWISRTPVPLIWVIARGTFLSLISGMIPDCYKGMTLRVIVSDIISKVGISISNSDWSLIVDMETAFQEMVQGRNQKFFLSKFLEKKVGTGRNYNWPLNDRESEINRIKSTFSWRITKPLRAIANTTRIFKKIMANI